MVGNLLDGEGGTALEEGVGLLRLVGMSRVFQHSYCVINHSVFLSEKEEITMAPIYIMIDQEGTGRNIQNLMLRRGLLHREMRSH